MSQAQLSSATANKLYTQYYDDWYAASNAVTANGSALTRGQDFDFHRILFRPRVGVQSRELTQLQTILQSQLQSLGSANFKDGQAVLRGENGLNTQVISGKVLPSDNVAAFFDRDTNTGQSVELTSNVVVKGTIRQFVAGDEGITPDSYLIIKYETSTEFPTASTIQVTGNAAVTATFATDANSAVFSPASIYSIEEGVFFVSGFFVRVKPQTIVLNPFSNLPNAIVGLNIIEEFLDELDDVVGETLKDPANQNAVGAHRLRLRLELAWVGLNATLGSNFITLATIINGVVQKGDVFRERFVRWSELNEILARRTYDESGDYILRHFAPVVTTDPTSEAHFRLALGPGKAYVHGYEVETTEPTLLQLRKGRVTSVVNNTSMALQVGNFVYATRVGAVSPLNYFGNTTTVDLHSVNISSINTSSTSSYNTSRIGQAKVRLLEEEEVPATSNGTTLANNSVFRLYFYDTAFDALTGNLSGGASIVGGAIRCTAAVANGMPLGNGALVGATVVLGGADSPVSGSFTINAYANTANTTHVSFDLKEFLPTLPNASTTWRLLLQPQDIEGFALYNGGTTAYTPYKANLVFQADIDPVHGRAETGVTLVRGGVGNALLYELPNKFLVANTLVAANTSWDTWLQMDANTVAMTGNGAIVEVAKTFPGVAFTTGLLSAATAASRLLVFDTTDDANGHGRMVEFTDVNDNERCLSSANATISGGNQLDVKFYYDHGASGGGTRAFQVFARVTAVGVAQRTKDFIVGNTTAILTGGANALLNGQIEYHTLNVAAGAAYTLKTPDVLNLKYVLYKSSNTDFTVDNLPGGASAATDVTSYFTLDNGQRDNTYEYARAIASSTANKVISPTGRLFFIFDWFQHGGAGYATVDSYLSDANALKGMTYDLIPSYTSPRTAREVSLRDTLDFRPAQSISGPLAADPFIYAANSTGFALDANTTYVTSSGTPYLIPASDSLWIGDYEYYLARIDQVGVSYDGRFRVIEGADSTAPVPPTDDTGSLLLYQISVPPYTLVDTNGTPTSTVLTTFDYKRFTMQDISKGENRVAHLEYYTALNSLETITHGQEILDGEGNERFKNGIVVDSFHGGDVGEVSSNDFTASIDTRNRELRTAFRTFNYGFSPDLDGSITGSTSSGCTLVGDMVIPDYSVVSFVSQPYATHAVSVNPFDIASFYGNVKLNPAVDIWKDTETLPAQVIDMGGPTEAWVKSNFPAYVSWGEWEQTWSGVTAVTPQRAWSTPPGWTEQDHGFRSMTVLSWQDVESQTTYQRQGTAYEYTVQTTSQSMGNRVVDTAIIHQCRQRDVVFSAAGLKPGSNLYAFFDGNSVDQYVQRGNILELDEVSTVTGPTLYLGQTVYVQKRLTGNAQVDTGVTSFVGAGTYYQYELTPGALVRIIKGGDVYTGFVAALTSNTAGTLITAPAFTATDAEIYTLTPVTVVEISPRYTATTVTYTIKVARAARDVDVDSGVPYAYAAGSLSPLKLKNDPGTTTANATLLIPASPKAVVNTIAIIGSTCYSGVVRSFNTSTGALRLDNDITDAEVVNGTLVHIVGGPGAGQTTTVESYTAANQTAILANKSLTNVTAGQSIYSIGQLAADGYIDPDNAIVAGRSGSAAGVFHLPASSFATGVRLFRLTDEVTNVPADATTAAETNYEASGLAVSQQETTVSSRQMVKQRIGPRQESFSVSSTEVQNLQIEYVDPLAETFLVDGKAYPQGVFIASVDLCFETVPAVDVPVIVELRNVVNGYPSSAELVPCCGGSGLAQVTLLREQVKTAAVPNIADPLTVTTFTFAAPVHLMPGKEYAIVVRSDSNQYRVFTAELGGTVLSASLSGTDVKVSKQPFAGSFFKSQNASTWTESPFEDLMFRLNRCEWTGTVATPQVALLVARGVPPAVNTAFDSIQFYPHDVHFTTMTAAAYTLGILPANLVSGDLTGTTALYYGVPANEWMPLSVRSMVMGHGDPRDASTSRIVPSFTTAALGSANTIDAMITLATRSTFVAPYLDIKKTNMLAIRHDINDMGLQADDVIITNPGAGYNVTKRSGGTETMDVENGNATVTRTAGKSVDVTTYLAAGDKVFFANGTANLIATVASVTNSSEFILTSAPSLAGDMGGADWFTYGGDLDGTNQTITLTVASDTGVDAAGTAHINRQGVIDSVSLTVNGTGYLDTPTVTVPAPGAVGGFDDVQTQGTLSYLSELSSHGGNGLTRYFTRQVTLADGFEAKDIKVWFDAYRPVGTKFYVYYKVLAVDNEAERFEDQPWRLMNQVTDNGVVSTKWEQFKEFEFKTPNNRALDDTADTSAKFRVFAVKLVMATTNTVNAPRVANFRAIALDN
jgi:hypothetical protein